MPSATKDREVQHKSSNPQPVNNAGMQPEADPPKTHDWAYGRTNSTKKDVPEIVEPDGWGKKNPPRSKKAKHGAGGTTKEQTNGDSKGSSTSDSQSLQVPVKERPLSPTMRFLAGPLRPALGQKGNSSSSGLDTMDTADSKTFTKKMKGYLSPKKSKNDANGAWDISLLQDRSGKKAAPEKPDFWIRFTLPVSEDREFVRWPDSEIYTIKECKEHSLPMMSYIFSAVPPKATGPKRELMVIFHIREWSTDMIEKPAVRCIRTIRELEGRALLSVNVEFDEQNDAELVKLQRQNAVKKMLEKAVMEATSEEVKHKF